LPAVRRADHPRAVLAQQHLCAGSAPHPGLVNSRGWTSLRRRSRAARTATAFAWWRSEMSVATAGHVLQRSGHRWSSSGKLEELGNMLVVLVTIADVAATQAFVGARFPLFLDVVDISTSMVAMQLVASSESRRGPAAVALARSRQPVLTGVLGLSMHFLPASLQAGLSAQAGPARMFSQAQRPTVVLG
jgi:hypothetical protein